MCDSLLTKKASFFLTGSLLQDIVIKAGETNETYGECNIPYYRGGDMHTVSCSNPASMIGRYVKIEPLDPPLYLSLCEVIIRGHIYNRNLTALSGNFRATRHRQLSLKIPPGFGVPCTDLNFSATTMWAPAEIFPHL